MAIPYSRSCPHFRSSCRFKFPHSSAPRFIQLLYYLISHQITRRRPVLLKTHFDTTTTSTRLTFPNSWSTVLGMIVVFLLQFPHLPLISPLLFFKMRIRLSWAFLNLADQNPPRWFIDAWAGQHFAQTGATHLFRTPITASTRKERKLVRRTNKWGLTVEKQNIWAHPPTKGGLLDSEIQWSV